ncbi:MAG: prepilin-type N-terminal cleavage/methylation domain-containing protein [Bacillota bacterium]
MDLDGLLDEKKGFTFIEILVAVVLLSLVIVPMLTAYTNLVRNSANVNQRDKAFDIAQNAADHFTYLYRQGTSNINNEIDNWNNGDWKNNFDFDGVDQYNLEINQSSENDGFILLEIEVSWEQKGEEQRVRLETLVEEDN